MDTQRQEPDSGSVLDLAHLSEAIRSGWTIDGIAPPSASSLQAAAAELAGRAYVDDDRAARREAESLLYRLNLESSFAPPLAPAAALVWSTLIQAKLAALRRRELDGDRFDGLASNEDMRRVLESAVAERGAHCHPLLGDLEANPDRLDAYRVWAKNWFGSCYGFSQQLAGLIQRTTGAAKRVVLENLTDEFGDDVTHDDLRGRFYNSLGLSHDPETAIDDADWVLESTELLNLRTGLCALSSALPALGAFYSVEANWPPECRRHHALNKSRGVDDRTLEYWTEHAFADEHHSAEWMEVVEDTCKSSEDRAAVVEGAVVQLRLRWRMYDSIRERVGALA